MKEILFIIYNSYTNEILGGKIVTQLIGVICENGEKVITVSDRMVSTGDMTLTFERQRMKATKITSKAVILTAGTVHQPDLIRETMAKAKNEATILDIANILKDVYQTCREQAMVDEILRPQLAIKSFDDFQRKQKDLDDHVVMGLMDRISTYDLGLHLILAGIDTEGHLFRFNNPGTYRSYDSLSYCSVGIGDRHTDTVFAWHRYSNRYSLNEAMYIAFTAKKRAEVAGGVGKLTDILVIEESGIYVIKDDTLDKLEKFYEENEEKSKQSRVDKQITEIEINKDLLE
jgi:hypothetical protein